MGLAATQVRLLQLTSRQHRIEYQAQKIQAQKLQLANESDAAYNTYMAALDAKKVQYKYIENDGSISYKDANFNNMFKGYDAGVQNLYALERIKTGTLILDSTILNNAKTIFNNQKTKTLGYNDIKKLPAYTYTETTTDSSGKTTTTTKYKLSESEYLENKDKYDNEYWANEFVKLFGVSDASAMAYYDNLFTLINEYGEDKLEAMNATYAENSAWFTNMLANSEVILHKWDTEAGDDGKGAWIETNVNTDLMLQEVADEKELKKAEATYEAENTRINRKDAQYDTLLSQTETERSAIKTEMDSLKTVRNDNIEKTFKCFS